MLVTSFRTSHDSRESTGYHIHTADGRRVVVATDTGCISEEIRTVLHGCDLVMIESNHDVQMLQSGPYPYYLKRRFWQKPATFPTRTVRVNCLLWRNAGPRAFFSVI